jgi:response regulator RpfG family c-di-GMP phosphodiesterase
MNIVNSDDHKGCILVVEDYPNWLLLIKQVLEDEGYQVLTASSFEDAEKKVETLSFDVAVLDMRLIDDEPYNYKGMALLKKLKIKAPSTGAIILTGYPDQEHEQRALQEYGADAYLSKTPTLKDDIPPFEIDDFMHLIARLITKRYR